MPADEMSLCSVWCLCRYKVMRSEEEEVERGGKGGRTAAAAINFLEALLLLLLLRICFFPRIFESAGFVSQRGLQ